MRRDRDYAGTLGHPELSAPSVQMIGRVDDEAETLLLFSRGNMLYGNTDAAARRTMLRAYAEFARIHGQAPTEPAQFQPYLRQPVDPQQLQRFWKQHGHLLR
jgi:hypothetical protein